MKLTKYAHACVAFEDNGTTIVIDPGVFTPDTAKIIGAAAAVLITHEHGDHVNKDDVQNALKNRDDLDIYGPQAVIDALGGEGEHLRSVQQGDHLEIGHFKIDVYGEVHEQIHADIPAVQNVCYLVNEKVFHPGDSFTQPGVPVDVLLLPTSGPWLKLGEAADYVRAVRPKRIIEIHERLNSDVGSHIANNILGEKGLTGIKLEQLEHGKSTEI